MGDRCSVSLVMRKADVERLKLESDWEDPVDGRPDLTRLNFDEVNYGMLEYVGLKGDENVDFVGEHGTGGDYGVGYYASAGGSVEAWTWDNGGPAVNLQTGDFSEHPRWRSFVAHRQHALAALGLPPSFL